MPYIIEMYNTINNTYQSFKTNNSTILTITSLCIIVLCIASPNLLMYEYPQMPQMNSDGCFIRTWLMYDVHTLNTE